MGGAQAGELASRLAAAALEEVGARLDGEEGVVGLIRTANARVFERALQDPEVAGMGTTVTVALVDEQREGSTIGHVGDSRAYRFRDGALEQLTADHSLVAELVRTGRLTEDEAAVHPQRSVITRALGTEPEVDVDTLTIELATGDLFLLCSDGLTAMVRGRRDRPRARSGRRRSASRRRALVDAANDAGGEDNVTVVLFELVERRARRLGAPPATPAEATDAADPDHGRHGATDEDVRRHGAGEGQPVAGPRLILVLLAVAALVLWWSIGGEHAQPRALQPRARRAGRVGRVRERLDRRRGAIDYGWLPWAAALAGLFLVAHISPARRCPTPTRRCCRSPASCARSG